VLAASWTAPTANTDGTPLTDLTSYRIYYGTSDPPCPGSSFVQVASPTPTPPVAQTVAFGLTGLVTGVLYHVAVTAVDTNGNESACSTIVTAVARTDATGPTVAITSPTANPTHSTSRSPFTISGTAADNIGVTQVTWANNRGGSGTASGTTSWSATGIVLLPGTNVLTITVRDAAGNTGTATLTVTGPGDDMDFTGDGKADVAVHDEQTGDWYVGVSTGTGFRIEAWASSLGNRGDAVEQVLVGDFTGDGKTDVVIHDTLTGNWYVGVSTGTAFRIELWASGFGNRGDTVEEVFVGDFTGDGKTDVAIHDKQTGNWYVGVSTGAGFRVELWASGFGNRGDAVEEVFVGDFTGDGKADVVIHDKQTGDWYVGVSTGTGFRVEPWASGFGNRGDAVEEVFVGDFTGDGKADVAIHDKQTGDWYVGGSTGANFLVGLWVTRFGNRGNAVEEIFVGDFTGDGKTDVAIHDRQTGNWYVGVSTGTSLRIEPWGSGFGTRGETVEQVLVGDFSGDGKTDVVIHDKQTGDWYLGVSTGAAFRIEHWVSGFGNRGDSIEEAFGGEAPDR
jgi:phenylpyruvate tautomerase PptA (4-oxalocrotonate tautomerase family)